jgi:hypothetical protein
MTSPQVVSGNTLSRTGSRSAMACVSAIEARKRLHVLIDEVGQSHEPLLIIGKQGNAVRAHMTAVIQHHPAPATAPLRQRVSHDGPDHHLPITGRWHGRRLVRCFISQPGTAKHALVKAGSPKASNSKGFQPNILTEKRKRAAGIEPASSAWKAEVLPLNYARRHHQNLAGSAWQ